MSSKLLELNLIDGTPKGVRILTRLNWSGQILVLPRASIKRIAELGWKESAAVYVLRGPNNQVYVGEADGLGSRLAHHELNKDFWEECVAITAPHMTKTEIEYAEHVLCQLLREGGLVTLTNGNVPQAPTMSAGRQAALDQFLEEALDILRAVGIELVSAFESEKKDSAQGLQVVCSGPSAKAEGVYSEKGLLVKHGSLARKEFAPSFQKGSSYAVLREQLVMSGVLKEQAEDSLVFDSEFLFSSASAAAAVVLGRAANGLNEWVDQQGKTLKELGF